VCLPNGRLATVWIGCSGVGAERCGAPPLTGADASRRESGQLRGWLSAEPLEYNRTFTVLSLVLQLQNERWLRAPGVSARGGRSRSGGRAVAEHVTHALVSEVCPACGTALRHASTARSSGGLGAVGRTACRVARCDAACRARRGAAPRCPTLSSRADDRPASPVGWASRRVRFRVGATGRGGRARMFVRNDLERQAVGQPLREGVACGKASPLTLGTGRSGGSFIAAGTPPAWRFVAAGPA